MFNAELTKDCASSVGSTGVREGDEAVWRSAPEASGKPFEIRVSEDHIKWTEDGLFSLEGPMIKPGLHWYLPAETMAPTMCRICLSCRASSRERKHAVLWHLIRSIWRKVAACIKIVML